jgi:hypothetical protein
LSSIVVIRTCPQILLVIRWSFGRGALGFTLRSFLILFSLLFIAPCACRSVSFVTVSAEIRPECHEILL